MKNDMIVKVTWVINKEQINEVYFDYLNKEGKYVGNIIVDEYGKASWYIMDAAYKDNINQTINYIMGNNEKRMLQYETKDLDVNRWLNTRRYIANQHLVLNFQQGNEYTSSIAKAGSR